MAVDVQPRWKSRMSPPIAAAEACRRPGIEIVLDAKARDWLATARYDPVYGARPLKRVIQRRLQDPLAEMLLEGDIGDGAKVKVNAGKLGLIVNGKTFDAREDSLDEPVLPSHAIH